MFHTFSHSSSHCIRQFDNERYNPMTTKKIMSLRSKVQVWECFSRFVVRILKRIRGNINSEIYQDLFVNDFNLIGKYLVFLLRSFIFQHDNAPSHLLGSLVV